jgi:hypothetical protein
LAGIKGLPWRKLLIPTATTLVVWGVLLGVFYAIFWHLTNTNCVEFHQGFRPDTDYHLYCTDPPRTFRQAVYTSRIVMVWLATIGLAVFSIRRTLKRPRGWMNTALILIWALVSLGCTLSTINILYTIFFLYRPY